MTSLLLALMWVSHRPALSQVPNKDVRRECPFSSSLPPSILINVLIGLLRLYPESGTLFRSVLLSVLWHALATGEYVFYFSAVVFGVHILFCFV